MPYYRIVVFLQEKVVTGLRYLEEMNIDRVQNIYLYRARKYYGKKALDVEVQMLSKTSTAVRLFLDKKSKEKEFWQEEQLVPPPYRQANRKDKKPNLPTLGERNK